MTFQKLCTIFTKPFQSIEGLINMGFFWFFIFTPSSVQCNVHFYNHVIQRNKKHRTIFYILYILQVLFRGMFSLQLLTFFRKEPTRYGPIMPFLDIPITCFHQAHTMAWPGAGRQTSLVTRGVPGHLEHRLLAGCQHREIHVSRFIAMNALS